MKKMEVVKKYFNYDEKKLYIGSIFFFPVYEDHEGYFCSMNNRLFKYDLDKDILYIWHHYFTGEKSINNWKQIDWKIFINNKLEYENNNIKCLNKLKG